MTKPNENQIAAAAALIKQHYRDYGNGAADTRLAALVYSIHAVLTDDGEPAAEYAQTLEDARQAEKIESVAEEVKPVFTSRAAIPTEPLVGMQDLPTNTAVAAPEPVAEPAAKADALEAKFEVEAEQNAEKNTGADTDTEEEEVDEDEDEFYTAEELEAMTIEDLTAIAQEGGLAIDETMDKAAIINLIQTAP